MRLAGDDRVRTAIALAQQWGAATRAVVVVPAGSPAEALVAAPLAALIDAPVLLTGPRGLDAEVAAEVRRLGARSAYVIGRTDQLALRTETDLSAAGITAMARIAAADPPALSAAVADELVSYPQMEGVSEVLLALGVSDVPSRTWPDALSASALAAHAKLPILLTHGDVLPPAVTGALALLHPDAVRVVGGTAAISDRVARDAGAAAGGAVVSRLAGASRYATSAAVAEAAVRAGLDGDRVWVATGRNYPDALAAGPAAARQKSPLLLVDGARVGGAPESEAWLAAQATRVGRAVVVGGTGAVSDAVAADLAQRLGR